jgi:CheY-like chemotaxis protein
MPYVDSSINYDSSGSPRRQTETAVGNVATGLRHLVERPSFLFANGAIDMFRLLIVEDDHDTCSALKEYLSRTVLPDNVELQIQIDTAETVSAAKRAIDVAMASKKPYHAIILDFHLPKESGYQPEMDQSLCLFVRTLMPSTTLIIHITAFMDDDVVVRHMKEFHDEQIDRSFRLTKTHGDWFGQLASKLKAFLYGTQIDEQISRLFEFAANSELESGTKHISTYKLAALSRDIVRHWSYLDDSVKDRIQRFFNVDSSTDPIRISLL